MAEIPPGYCQHSSRGQLRNYHHHLPLVTDKEVSSSHTSSMHHASLRNWQRARKAFPCVSALRGVHRLILRCHCSMASCTSRDSSLCSRLSVPRDHARSEQASHKAQLFEHSLPGSPVNSRPRVKCALAGASRGGVLQLQSARQSFTARLLASNTSPPKRTQKADRKLRDDPIRFRRSYHPSQPYDKTRFNLFLWHSLLMASHFLEVSSPVYPSYELLAFMAYVARDSSFLVNPLCMPFPQSLCKMLQQRQGLRSASLLS